MSTQPLSSFNVFHELQQEICDVMNASPAVISAGIEFIAENRLDIDYQIKESLQKQGMAAVVMTPTAQYLGHTGENEVYQLDDFTIQFVEYTPINRAKNKDVVVTGLDLANYTSELLGGPNAVIGFGNLCPGSIEQGEDEGLLVTKVVFKTTITNGSQPIIYIPFVTREEMEAYVGNGALVFTKDGQRIGEFKANQHTDTELEIPNSGVWGQITGDIEDQSDLIDKISERASQEQVDEIEEKIPAAATSENQLADKAFVNSSINNYAAFYLTKNANGDAFGTYAQLSSATKFYNAGVERTPSKNDYLVVLEDETKTTALSVNPTTRYTYQGEWPTGQFEFQYIVNNTSLTQAQINAINSGITKSIVDSRVIPSTDPTYAGYAENAVRANEADWASTTPYATEAAYAIDNGETYTWENIINKYADLISLSSAIEQEYAKKDDLSAYALSVDVRDNYTSLELFNQTLGNLSAIIHGI